jgi:hypothetical protein
MTNDQSQPIFSCIQRWHQQLRGELPGGLDAILHEDCVFASPIVFTPQKGRELTKMYLAAAGGTFAGDPEQGAVVGTSDDDDGAADGEDDGKFHYVKKILQGNQAMLEFEASVEGKYVNGVDIITCDDDGLITEFKVMIRPLQAINLMHAQMKAMIERLNA